MKTLKPILVMMFLLGLSVSAVHGSDWTKWRGPNGNGISPEKDWNPEALKRGIHVLWETSIGMGHSASVVQGDRLYNMGNRTLISGTDTMHTDIIWCLDTQSGKEVWRYAYPCRDGLDPGPGSSPVLDGNRLYTLSREGHLYCFNAENGRVLWMKNIVSDSLVPEHNWGFSCSPVIDGNLLILNANTGGIALNKNNGRLVWNSEKGESWFATAVPYQFDNQRLTLISTQAAISAVETETGKLHWSVPWESSCADPIVVNGKMLISGRGSGLFDITKEEPVELWKNRRVNGDFQSWVVVDGHSYGFSNQGRRNPFRCIDIKTGEVKWSENIGHMGAVISAKGKLIILTRDGNIVIAEASPDGFQRISSARIVPMTDNTGIHNRRQCHCWTHPILSKGILYARNTFGTVVAVDLKK